MAGTHTPRSYLPSRKMDRGFFFPLLAVPSQRNVIPLVLFTSRPTLIPSWPCSADKYSSANPLQVAIVLQGRPPTATPLGGEREAYLDGSQYSMSLSAAVAARINSNPARPLPPKPSEPLWEAFLVILLHCFLSSFFNSPVFACAHVWRWCSEYLSRLS